ncbi:PH domain-containing protein [Drepanopeziza brunnea f. sp. 'multigermtubi' MB_m1]|uniref:PH domain-containing protein n=2 Tax=Drepanopeziza brunnea f. sp. 'multigermtubi' TaxID=698441 RepID=K1WTV8_MARBU|nr:PH domain-containing protein [Drepanopeziza brunnea f. sp. 'multigermtubi' MB_m1]EKD21075.1 PH domain-containing protein [Drepanopeziza brunnea f. sp. 'multigermtubi' MB_m1]
MDECHQQDGDTPVDLPGEPPSYDSLLDPPILRRKYNIQPREDEGREILPAYSSAISIQNVFSKKMELEGVVQKARDRTWYKVLATLQGTALKFHKLKGHSLFLGKDDGEKLGSSISSKKGSFLKSYNLQYADVGIAADYIKKPFVIRVRAETDQFLLSCNKIETFVTWLQSLFAAIDLAPPLDDREIPRDISIPRRTRRRARARISTVRPDANLVREQEEIISSQFPRLGEASVDNADTSTTQEDIETFAEETESSCTPPSIAVSSPTQSESRPNLFSRARQAIYSTTHLNLTAAATPNPSITSDGKWRPEHQWTPFYDMLYAKRCMAILTLRSPRKSNLVIVKGKQWIVDLATGKLERYQPPDYGELEGKELTGGSAVRRNRIFTRA